MVVRKQFYRVVEGALNKGVRALSDSGRWSHLVDWGIVVITYTGRRSGRSFSTPVGYLAGPGADQITIGVERPGDKTWWRNFVGAGGPLSVRLKGTERAAHAVAHQDGGKVTVTVQLAQP
ncbi:hypothetical protein GFY24_33675 [Nocardia sp. SYP-A9097]|uniref:hypothetical protein n=1 Tax=Nocardia sp. SYP-A9097 TaxID=2663237 RepID=UPI001328B1E1|nr:hypothetical protein [Nocardia sp. SYP-A9097]MRH92326.1 hypothetical protein [Nocardia sp. SYP-A9097]